MQSSLNIAAMENLYVVGVIGYLCKMLAKLNSYSNLATQKI